MHRIALVVALAVPLLATAQGDCPKGYQPYANRCVTQRMADYISCIEASGGNKQTISDELTQIGGNKTGGSVTASGGNTVIKGAGSITLDKKSESALVKKLEAKWFSGGMSECAKALKPQSTSAVPPELKKTLQHLAESAPYRDYPVIDLSTNSSTQIQLFATDEVTIVGLSHGISKIQLGSNLSDYRSEDQGVRKFTVWGSPDESITPVFFGNDGQQLHEGHVKLLVEYRATVDTPRDLRPPDNSKEVAKR